MPTASHIDVIAIALKAVIEKMSNATKRISMFWPVPLLALCACMLSACTTPVATHAPHVFAPGVISRAPHEAAPAFTPDGHTLFFSRADGTRSTILVSHLDHGHWAPPAVASFSGTWRDMEPAMAPDGSYLVFASNRPISPGGQAIDGIFNGKRQPKQGGNLWRIDRHNDGWGTPQRLPTSINAGTTVFSPSIARDGSLYFMRPDPRTGRFRLYRAPWRHGHYLPPQPLPFSTGASTDVDPAVDPDQRFLVFGSSRKPAAGIDLFIVFHGAHGWGTPVHMGTVVNAPGSDAEPRLSPDAATLYFSSVRKLAGHEHDDAATPAWNNGKYNIWTFDLAQWLQHHGHPALANPRIRTP